MIYNVREASAFALGAYDFVEISSETKSPPAGFIYGALVSDTDATYTAETAGGDNLSTQTRQAGNIRFGRFTSVNETGGGVVLAYLFPVGE